MHSEPSTRCSPPPFPSKSWGGLDCSTIGLFHSSASRLVVSPGVGGRPQALTLVGRVDTSDAGIARLIASAAHCSGNLRNGRGRPYL